MVANPLHPVRRDMAVESRLCRQAEGWSANVNLFQYGVFKLASGRTSDFKIECDALKNADYEALANVICHQMVFSKVYGVPSGGLHFADVLHHRAVEASRCILIVDDVYTTGLSINHYRVEVERQNPGRVIKGVVIFARDEISWQDRRWISPIFAKGGFEL